MIIPHWSFGAYDLFVKIRTTFQVARNRILPNNQAEHVTKKLTVSSLNAPALPCQISRSQTVRSLSSTLIVRLKIAVTLCKVLKVIFTRFYLDQQVRLVPKLVRPRTVACTTQYQLSCVRPVPMPRYHHKLLSFQEFSDLNRIFQHQFCVVVKSVNMGAGILLSNEHIRLYYQSVFEMVSTLRNLNEIAIKVSLRDHKQLMCW